MPHLVKIPVPPPESGLWSKYAARDLDVVVHYLRQADKQRRGCAERSASVLGALISYSRPFTECGNPQLEQYPGERRCFLSLAADLGADLHVHSILLQARDQAMALSEIVPMPPVQLSARRFKYPDPGLARITRNLDLDDFRRLTVTMRIACLFFGAEMDFRRL
jgi:hypothetical protein